MKISGEQRSGGGRKGKEREGLERNTYFKYHNDSIEYYE